MTRHVILTVRTKTGESFISNSSIEVDPGVDLVMNMVMLLAQMRELGYLRVGKVADWAGEVVLPLDNIAFMTISEGPR